MLLRRYNIAFLIVCWAILVVRCSNASIDPYHELSSSALGGDEEDEENSGSRNRNIKPPPVPPDDDDLDEGEDDITRITRTKKKIKPPESSSSGNNNYNSKGDDNKNNVNFGSETLWIHIVPHTNIDHGWLQTIDQNEETVFDILTSVTQQLDLDNKRKFVWAETWYFRRWFDTLSSNKKERIRRMVNDGRLEFVGGGLVQHDEMLTSSKLVIEEILEGQVFLEQTFNLPPPKIAWQIDSLGHSDATPGLLSKLGYSAVVLNHVHFRTKQRFRKGQHLEFLWRGPKAYSSSVIATNENQFDETNQIFAHLLVDSFTGPEGYDFEKSGARQVTQPRTRATKLLQYARELSRSFRTHHVMIPWGDDFRFREADKQFANMDKIIAEITSENPSVRISYSSVGEYFDQVHRAASASNVRFPVFQGDFLPFADSGDGYWTGLYSSRLGLKRSLRQLEHKVFWSGALFALARNRQAQSGHVPRVHSVEAETGRLIADEGKAPASWGTGLYRQFIFAKRQLLLMGTSHHSATGFVKEAVVKDFVKRIKSAQDAAVRVGLEALSFLLMKRKSQFDAPGPHVRPPIKQWNPNDVLEIREDGKQWPLIFTNEQATWKKEVLVIRLDCPTWATAKRIKVVEAGSGNPVPSQVHKSLVSSVTNDEGGWKMDLHLYIYAEIPPLGFQTYFISASTSSDRLSATSSFAAYVTSTVFDLVDGHVVPPHGGGSSNKEALEGIKIANYLPSAKSRDGGSNCLPIDNDRLLVDFDCVTFLIRAVNDKKLKKRVVLNQQYRVHESSRGGPALFRPDRLESSQLEVGEKGRVTIGIAKGPLVQELQLLGDGIAQTVRIVRAPSGLDPLAALQLEGHVFVSHAVAGTTPDVDTVVRYSTDLKTNGAFYTDNPAGSLRERKGLMDAPLPSAFYPCAHSLFVKSNQQIMFGILLSQACGCTGAAGIGSGKGDFGIIELVVHRNPTKDDERGLGEGLRDFGVSRLDTFLYFDTPEQAAYRRLALIPRIHSAGDLLGVATIDYSHSLLPLLSREVWLSRFLTSASYLNRKVQNLLVVNTNGGGRMLSILPKDETSDDVVVRFETFGESSSKIDWSEFFNAEEVLVLGGREVKSVNAQRKLVFPASELKDDFRSANDAVNGGGGGGGSSGNEGKNGNTYVLSEYALREIGGDSEFPTTPTDKTARKLGVSKNVAAQSLSVPAPGAGAIGGNFPCAVNLETKFRTFSLPLELKRNDLHFFIVSIAGVADDKVAAAAAAAVKGNAKVPLQSENKAHHVPESNDASKPMASATLKTDGNTELVTNKDKSRFNSFDEKVSSLPPIPEDRRTRISPPVTTSTTSKGGNGDRPVLNQLRGDLSNLRGDLVGEEKRHAALVVRSKRLQQNVDELLQELELFQDLDGGGVDKKAALEELSRAEEQLVENQILLKQSAEKIATLQRDLDHVEALDELRARHHPRRRGESSDSSTTLHVLGGAGGMLVFIIAFQWLLGGGRRRNQQAFVPVRYVPVQGQHFAVPVKRL